MGSQKKTIKLLSMHLLTPLLIVVIVGSSQAFFGLFGISGGNSFCNGRACDHTYNFRPCSYYNPGGCICSAGTCPGGYEKSTDGKCYIVRTGQTSWADAQAKCRAAGDIGLATITTQAQITASKTAAAKSDNDIYIGLGDAATEGTYLWNDGSTLGSTDWLNGAPTSNANQDCVKMRKATVANPQKWQVVGCSKTQTDNFDFLCERKATC